MRIVGASSNDTVDIKTFDNSEPGDVRALIDFNDPVNGLGGQASSGELTVGTISSGSDLEVTSISAEFALDDGNVNGTFSGTIKACYCTGLIDATAPGKKKKKS
jgi:hypothetical protein